MAVLYSGPEFIVEQGFFQQKFTVTNVLTGQKLQPAGHYHDKFVMTWRAIRSSNVGTASERRVAENTLFYMFANGVFDKHGEASITILFEATHELATGLIRAARLAT